MTDKDLKEVCKNASVAAQPELENIAAQAIAQHGSPAIEDKQELLRLTLIMDTVQANTFTLGVRIGIELIQQVMKQVVAEQERVQ